jgi:flagellar hook-length control protein FliK
MSITPLPRGRAASRGDRSPTDPSAAPARPRRTVSHRRGPSHAPAPSGAPAPRPANGDAGARPPAPRRFQDELCDRCGPNRPSAGGTAHGPGTAASQSLSTPSGGSADADSPSGKTPPQTPGLSPGEASGVQPAPSSLPGTPLSTGGGYPARGAADGEPGPSSGPASGAIESPNAADPGTRAAEARAAHDPAVPAGAPSKEALAGLTRNPVGNSPAGPTAASDAELERLFAGKIRLPSPTGAEASLPGQPPSPEAETTDPSSDPQRFRDASAAGPGPDLSGGMEIPWLPGQPGAPAALDASLSPVPGAPPSAAGEATESPAENTFRSASSLAALPGGGRDSGDPNRLHPLPAPGQKDPTASSFVPPPLRGASVDQQPDTRTAPAAAGASRPAWAEAVTLPNLPARLAQLAAGLPDRGSAGVRLRLDPPSLGEIRVHIESTLRGIEVRIVAQSHEACALLADGQSQLSKELWRQGLSLHSFAASVGREGTDDAAARQRANHGSKPAEPAASRAPAPSGPDTGAPAPATPAAARRIDRRV